MVRGSTDNSYADYARPDHPYKSTMGYSGEHDGPNKQLASGPSPSIFSSAGTSHNYTEEYRNINTLQNTLLHNVAGQNTDRHSLLLFIT